MRLPGLGLVGLTACAPVFGLDPPVLATGDASANDDVARPPCQGDNFDDNMINTTLWSTYTEGAVQVVERNQRLEIVLDGQNGSSYSGVDAIKPLAPSETGVQVEVLQPSRDDATESVLGLFVNAGNRLDLGKDAATLRAAVRTAGVTETRYAPWVPSLRFLRIERATDQVKFSTSFDGSTWAVLWTTPFAFSMQNLKPTIYAGHYMQAEVATIAFDNFNVLNADCDPR